MNKPGICIECIHCKDTRSFFKRFFRVPERFSYRCMHKDSRNNVDGYATPCETVRLRCCDGRPPKFQAK